MSNLMSEEDKKAYLREDEYYDNERKPEVKDYIGNHPFKEARDCLKFGVPLFVLSIIIFSSSPDEVAVNILGFLMLIVSLFLFFISVVAFLANMGKVSSYNKMKNKILSGEVTPDFCIQGCIVGSWMVIDREANKIIIEDKTYKLSDLNRMKIYYASARHGVIKLTFRTGASPVAKVFIDYHDQADQEYARMRNFLGWN